MFCVLHATSLNSSGPDRPPRHQPRPSVAARFLGPAGGQSRRYPGFAKAPDFGVGIEFRMLFAPDAAECVAFASDRAAEIGAAGEDGCGEIGFGAEFGAAERRGFGELRYVALPPRARTERAREGCGE